MHMTPESIGANQLRAAVERARAQVSEAQIDDETIAAVIEDGIDAIPEAQRAVVLRTIASDPALCALVAALASEGAGASEFTIFSIRRETWRAALAACATLALGAGVWWMLSPAPVQHPVQVLDTSTGTMVARDQTFVEWFSGAPLQTSVVVLVSCCCLLSIPSFLPSRRAVGAIDSPKRS
jgi:hypothetical protein